MEQNYSKLFERTKIGKMSLKNRFVMSPMGTLLSENDGSLAYEGIDYYVERAAGGVGMIITEGQPASNKIDWMFASYTGLDTGTTQRKWSKLTERVHAYGCRACLQLILGLGRNGLPNPYLPPLPAASESPMYYNPSIKTKALEVSEIKDAIIATGQTALKGKMAGFDCIEIHGHTGYILDTFMTEIWNQRTDEYGGSFENRMRFSKELIEEIRRQVGPDFPILFRLSLEHKFEGGRTVEEGLEIVKALDSYGVDAFDIDAGSYEAHDWVFPTTYLGDACMVDYAALAKTVTNKPVLNSGNYTADTAANAVNSGKTDYVMLGRSLIADPQFVNKLYAGAPEKIRPCLRCDEYCVGGINRGRTLSCAVNAAAGMEKTYVITKTETPKNIVVIGGGPAGLESARVLRQKGHIVTLFEKSETLGGQVIAASSASFKLALRRYLSWLIRENEELGVKIVKGKEITADSAELKDADQIIVAVGATEINPPISGIERTVSVIDGHINEVSGQKVIICGGGMSGCDFALELAMQGKDVSIVEMMDSIASKAYEDNYVSITRELNKYNVNIMTGHKVLQIDPDGVVTLDKDGNEKKLYSDVVISAFGMKSRTQLKDDICNKYPTAIAIGDCENVAQVGEAVRAAFFVAWAMN